MILVYQMGKVGSTSIVRALQRRPDLGPSYSVHFLTDETGQYFEKQVRDAESTNDQTLHNAKSTLALLAASAQVRMQCKQVLQQGNPIKIITATRDPVDYVVSAFFQNISVVCPLYEKFFVADRGLTRVLQSFFLQMWRNALSGERGQTYAERHIYPLFAQPLVWFDQELRAVFDIDVYQADFDIGNGRAIVNKGPIDVLIYRFENMGTIIEAALENFLGTPIKVERENVGADKDSSALYEEFRRSLVVPEDILEQVYNSLYARRFYSTEEIDGFSKKWSGQLGHVGPETTFAAAIAKRGLV